MESVTSARVGPGAPGQTDARIEFWLEDEDPEETAAIERQKKEQKEREKTLAEQRRRAREQGWSQMKDSPNRDAARIIV